MDFQLIYVCAEIDVECIWKDPPHRVSDEIGCPIRETSARTKRNARHDFRQDGELAVAAPMFRAFQN